MKKHSLLLITLLAAGLAFAVHADDSKTAATENTVAVLTPGETKKLTEALNIQQVRDWLGVLDTEVKKAAREKTGAEQNKAVLDLLQKFTGGLAKLQETLTRENKTTTAESVRELANTFKDADSLARLAQIPQATRRLDDKTLAILSEKLAPFSAFERGKNFHFGQNNAAPNWAEAVKHYTLAANNGHADAQCNLGIIYSQGGYGIEADQDAAKTWFEKAASLGNSESQYRIGNLCSPAEAARALDWYERAVRQNHTAAKNRLAECLLLGEGVAKSEKNDERAARLLKEAATQKNTDAMFNLGKLHHGLFGARKNFPRNYTEAKKWLEEAAKLDHAEAQWQLGMMHYNGLGGRRDAAEAKKWLEKAGEQNHTGALYRLGLSHFMGEGGFKEDYAEAVKWFEKAAALDHAEAQHKLGECYFKGFGVESNESTAKEWFGKAAENGNVESQYRLGVYYLGRRTDVNVIYVRNASERTENETKGVAWLQKAADKNHKEAQYHLGLCYFHGEGVPKNYPKAREWFQKASNQGGHFMAEHYLRQIEK